MAGGPIAIPTCIVGNVPGLGGILGGAVLNGIAVAVDLVVGVIAAIVKTIAELVSAGMIKAINAFMDIPISPGNPGTPTAIKEAWSAVRNIVNVIFILVLTFIGLATILRLQSYQLQKTLPSLMIVALLINFSGVLVGFIVDIG